MFRPSLAIAASVQRARNPQAEFERLALGRWEAWPPGLAMEWEAWMLQLPENSLPLLALPLFELPWLALPLLMSPLSPLRVLLVLLLPSYSVPLPTDRAGPPRVDHLRLATDIQSVRESDRDTRRSLWCSHARPTLQRPLRSPEPWTGNSHAGSGQAVDHPEERTHPTPEDGRRTKTLYPSRPSRRLLSIPRNCAHTRRPALCRVRRAK